MEQQKLARRMVAWLGKADPLINIEWGSGEYDDEVTTFLWQHYLEPVAEVAARIKTDYRLEESEVTDSGVPISEDQ